MTVSSELPEQTESAVAELAVQVRRSLAEQGIDADLPALTKKMAVGRSTRKRNLMGQLAFPRLPFDVFFDGGEHAVIARQLRFSNGIVDATTYQLVFKQPGQNGLSLTYGQIVALAGDFYADQHRPISNQVGISGQMAQVQANFNSLVVGKASFNEATSILQTMQTEVQATQWAELSGTDPSNAYAVAGNSFDLKYNGITGGSYTDPKTPGRYELIAATNWDHFGADAWTAYYAAHLLALQMASVANNDSDLAQAYAVNAFADHYLTDLFSAGHLRTLRRQMYERQYGATGPVVDPKASYWTPDSAVSGLLAKCMHDEDSVNGLWVSNAANDFWLCFGDSRYRDPENYVNATMVQKAVAVSTGEVWQAFSQRPVIVISGTGASSHLTGAPLEMSGYFSVKNLLPRVRDDLSPALNYSPLFILSQESLPQVLNRNDESDLLDYTHSTFSLYTAYHQSPDTPLRGPSLLLAHTMSGPDIPPMQFNPIAGSGGPGFGQSPIAAVVDANGRVDLVAYSSGVLFWRTQSGTTWNNWQAIGIGGSILGPTLTSVPSVTTWGSGHLNVLVADVKGDVLQNGCTNDVWQHAQPTSLWRTAATGSWHSTPLSVAPANNHLAVYGITRQGLFEFTWDGSKWSTPVSMQGKLSGDLACLPAVISRSANSQDLFALLANGNPVYTNSASVAWVELMLPGGIQLASPLAAASWGSSRMDWMARNANGSISHNWNNSGSWDKYGEILSDANTIATPLLASCGNNTLDLFYVGTDGFLRNRLYNNGTWQSEITWSGQPRVVRQPTVASNGSRIDIFYLGYDGQLHHCTRATVTSAWGAWESLGSWVSTSPAGYSPCAHEGDTKNFTTSVDVAYGVAGHFNYQYRVTGSIAFNNTTFGDPAVGSPKYGFVRNALTPDATDTPAGYTYCADENQSYNFKSTVDVAYGASGNYTFRSGVIGSIIFNNSTFGDPAPTIVKKGYYRKPS